MNSAAVGLCLLTWYAREGRILPFRNTRDPYRIWLSEVIMQQTQVAQGLPYYERFVAQFPDVFALAAADEQAVLKAWEGLGYYSRARNLHATARRIAEAAGAFPTTVEGLLALPGVGPYTARAIASLAFDVEAAVVDGNVFRVLSRLFDDDTPIDSSPARLHFQKLADRLVAGHDAGRFNQAMMDLGALICRPKAPRCDVCPLNDLCAGRARAHELPRKAKKPKVGLRYFTCYYILREDGALALRRRTGPGWWRGLWELPGVEVENFAAPPEGPLLGTHVHRLTHFEMRLRLTARPAEGYVLQENEIWAAPADMAALPLPKAMRVLLELAETAMLPVEPKRTQFFEAESAAYGP